MAQTPITNATTMAPPASPPQHWDIPFLSQNAATERSQWALIVLNQPFPPHLFEQLWRATSWHSFADGAANRAYDIMGARRSEYLPDLIKGDLDSIKPSVQKWYEDKGVPVVEDTDQYATDLMKCIESLQEVELQRAISSLSSSSSPSAPNPPPQMGLIILGGLSGRIDQTVHTMSLLHKLRKTRERTYVVTEDNVAWMLDSGEHNITVDQSIVGPTCGLLPVGVSSTILSTTGLEWNLTDQESSFDGLVSTSNHLKLDHVWIRTSHPIWWCVELREQPDTQPST